MTVRQELTLLLGGHPGAGPEDLVQVEGHGALLNQSLHLGPLGGRQDPHQSLGGKPVLGPLLVVSLGHVVEHEVSGLVDVVDDLAEVSLEVVLGEVFEVGEGSGGDVSLPLEVALAGLTQLSHPAVGGHVINKGAADGEILGGDGALATGGERHG